MHAQFRAFISAFFFLVIFSGCVSIRAHIVERPRVDQELPEGAEAQYPNRDKTRQVIEIEVEDKNKQNMDWKESTGVEKTSVGQSKVMEGAKETVVVHDSNFTFPNMNTQTLTQRDVASTLTVEQYSIQKDDTLQKIAKKLYGSYSKWTLIYDVNRDVIKDPNFLKPGTLLKIPVLPYVTPEQSTAVPESGANRTDNK